MMPDRRAILSSFIKALVLVSASLPLPAAAVTQVLYVSAGKFAGELHCPDRNRPAPPPRSREKALAPPGLEELAGLPLRREAYAQAIFLGVHNRLYPDKPFSIGFWGDSHAASSYFSEEMMRALGLTRDKVHPTFIPPTMDRTGVRLPIHKHCQSAGWSYEYAYVANPANAGFAKGLANLKSNVPNSYLWVDFRRQPPASALRSLDILYAPPGAGERSFVGIVADDGVEKIVELKAEGRGVIRVTAARPFSTIKLRLLRGVFVLQGFVPQYVERPALYLDTLGIPGATVRGWKVSNSEYLKQMDGNVAYDLVILEYGTNEGNDQNLDLGKYTADLRASLKNMRQVYPDSLCVLIGPTDRGVLVRRASARVYGYTPPPKGLLDYSHIHHRIGQIQAAVGKEYSCAFWSWQDAMGGPGGAYMWLHNSPPLMASDMIHLTVTGYQLSARKFIADTRLSDYVYNRPD